MSKAKVVKGKDLMIFINGKATALATSHSLELNAETSEAASKDDGAWSNATVTKKSWTASTEALVSEDPEVDSFDSMYDLFDAGEPVDIISGRPVVICFLFSTFDVLETTCCKFFDFIILV
mgnify:CR=1 FL=1